MTVFQSFLSTTVPPCSPKACKDMRTCRCIERAGNQFRDGCVVSSNHNRPPDSASATAAERLDFGSWMEICLMALFYYQSGPASGPPLINFALHVGMSHWKTYTDYMLSYTDEAQCAVEQTKRVAGAETSYVSPHPAEEPPPRSSEDRPGEADFQGIHRN